MNYLTQHCDSLLHFWIFLLLIALFNLSNMVLYFIVYTYYPVFTIFFFSLLILNVLHFPFLFLGEILTKTLNPVNSNVVLVKKDIGEHD